MKSIQQRWLEGSLLLCLCKTAVAFQGQIRAQRKNSFQLKAFVDPNEIASAVSGHGSHSEIPALLSTMLTSAIQPAQGHSNPLFGPPDQYLAAGKSIAPSAKALADMGITQAKTASELIPDAPSALQEAIAAAMNKGKLLNGANMVNSGASSLPGFAETRGILPTHSPNVPPETPESFAQELKWGARYLNVMDNLPFVAFWYAMVEFFFLRPNIDLYKEDIENDPVGATADTVSVAAVRFFAIAIISILTLVIAG